MAKKNKPTTLPTDELRQAAQVSSDALRLAVEAKLETMKFAPKAPKEQRVTQAPHAPSGPRRRHIARFRRLAAERARRRIEGLKLYEPHGPQDEFHKCRAPEVVLRGGNRSGKSTAAFVEFARAVTGQDPYRKYPKRDGIAILIGFDEGHCRDVFYPRLFKANREVRMIRDLDTGCWRTFRRWQDEGREQEAKPAPPLIPPRMIVPNSWAWVKKAHRIFRSVRLKNGWEIRFYSSRAKEAQGFTADLILIDEDIDNEDWIPEMQGRLPDRGGRLLWSALPKSRNRALLTMSKRAWRTAGDKNPPVVEYVLRFRNNPHIGEREKSQAIEAWTAAGPEVLRMRDSGEYLLDEYRMFPEFSMGLHGVPATAGELKDGRLPGNWCRYAVIDPGYATMAVLFAALPPPDFGDYVYLEDELYLKNCSDGDFAEAMHEKTHGKSYRAFIIDLHGSARTETGGLTIRQQLTNALRKKGVRSEDTGFGFWLGSDNKRGRIMAVHGWMAPRSGGRPPKLRVLEGRLPNFLMEMEGYMRRRVGKITTDEPDDRRDNHLMQCLQYLAHCPAVRYVEPQPPPRRRSPIVDLARKLRRQQRGGKGPRGYVHMGSGAA